MPWTILVTRRCVYVIPKRDPAEFMADFDDGVALNHLLLPGKSLSM